MKQPLVSILIPAYNAERYLEEALDSAVAQTWPNFEVVVVDDGSKDKTAEIIKKYAARDSRVRYIYQENQGVVGVRNKLIRESCGEYLTYLDSDDIYLPDKIKEEAEFLVANPDHAAVYCDLRYFYDGTPEKLYRHIYKFYGGDLFEKLLDKLFITNTTFMMRRAVVDKIGMYRDEIGVVEDWDFFLRMTRRGMKIGFLEKDLVRFRLRWDNNTRFGNQVKIQRSGLNIFEDLAGGMTPEERRRYRMDGRIASKKIRLAVVQLAAGEKKSFYKTWRDAKKGVGWRLLSWPVNALAAILPASFFRFIVEQGWNLKKKNLFTPVA